MDTKFKIGDKVRVIGGGGRWLPVGAEGEIVDIDLTTPDESHDVRTYHAQWWMAEKDLEAGGDEPVNPAPNYATEEGKHWIIAVLSQMGSPLPAEAPRVFRSAEQARAVARTMAEKNPGRRFVVYEATDVAYVKPSPTVELFML